MKKKWIYLLGVLTGAVVTFIILMIIGLQNIKKANTPMTFFEQVGEEFNISYCRVFQALEKGAALAYGSYNAITIDGKIHLNKNLIVLLYNEDGIPYYDDQVIGANQDQCFRQVGIYRYQTKSKDTKTVPIVMLMDR